MNRLAIAVILIAVTGAQAFAQTAPVLEPPRGVNMAQVLNDGSGNPIPEQCDTAAVPATDKEPAKPASECHAFTVGYALRLVLLQPTYPGEEKMDGGALASIKTARYFLALKIEKATDSSVDAEHYMPLKEKERIDIKGHVALRFLSPVIVGQIMNLIDPTGSVDMP